MIMPNNILSAAELIDFIHEVGFLPLLDSGIPGYSAEEVVDEECRYVVFLDGGWDWPVWKWKGAIVTEGNCMYGKFFNRKAGFIAREWCPDFINYRRSISPVPAPNSIEDTILRTLQTEGSLITRELRALCGFDGGKMRGTFDGYVTRLQMGCYVVTEDFIYPKDKHGNDYGWGWSLLTTPEQLYGSDYIRACLTDLCEGRTPQESRERILRHLRNILPDATDKQLQKLI